MITATRGAFTAIILLAATTAAPGQTARGQKPGETWPFRPERDTFRADAPGPPLDERAGRWRARIHPVSEDKNGLRPRRRCSDPFLGRQHGRRPRTQSRGARAPRPVPRQARRQPGPPPRVPRVARQESRSQRRRPQSHRRGLAAGRCHEEGGDLHVDQPLLGDGAEARPGVVGHRGLAREPGGRRIALLQPAAPGGVQDVAQGAAGPGQSLYQESRWPRTPRWR